jgi:hypothetical protein
MKSSQVVSPHEVEDGADKVLPLAISAPLKRKLPHDEDEDMFLFRRVRIKTSIVLPAEDSGPHGLQGTLDLNVNMPKLEKLDVIVQQKKWGDRAREAHGQYLKLKDVITIIEDGEKLGIPESNYFLLHFRKQKEAGEAWDAKAKELMSVETVHYPQLEALRNQAKAATLPVSADTLAAVDYILNKQR